MLEVADIFRLHGAAYRARFGSRLLPSHQRAMHDIEACRTPYFGGHVKQCDGCGHKLYAYHSCGNRHCPKCHTSQTERWLDKQRRRLLPCQHYLVTFTLPAELRSLARTHQRVVYGLLMRTAATALRELCLDPRYLGARIGCLAVLHTWTRAMLYHPHVHMLVTAGGLSADGTRWIEPKSPSYLVPVRALSVIFRAKLCAALAQAGLLTSLPPSLRHKGWVVHCQPAGRGRKVLDYLGRYVFRIAITNSRLERIEDGQVTFRYRDNRTHELRRVTLPALDFIGRFLEHVLPRGCTKVRYYGIWSSSCCRQIKTVRDLLDAAPPIAAVPPVSPVSPSEPPPRVAASQLHCPLCHEGRLIVVEVLRPYRAIPP
jgi:hypothetical protein